LRDDVGVPKFQEKGRKKGRGRKGGKKGKGGGCLIMTATLTRHLGAELASCEGLVQKKKIRKEK